MNKDKKAAPPAVQGIVIEQSAQWWKRYHAKGRLPGVEYFNPNKYKNWLF